MEMDNCFVKLFEHNNWANREIIKACAALSAEQLDATPQPTSTWSIRHTLTHFVESQQAYVSLLTLQPEERQFVALSSAELEESARKSGEALLALARDKVGESLKTQIVTLDGYKVEPWVVMVQAINHATEHRRQVVIMLLAVGVTPPALDGWTFGESAKAIVPIPPSSK
jgi:uncharacterized damage-inducible protein DinB